VAKIAVNLRTKFRARGNEKAKMTAVRAEHACVRPQFVFVVPDVLEHVDADDGVPSRSSINFMDRSLDHIGAGKNLPEFCAVSGLPFDRDETADSRLAKQNTSAVTDSRADFDHFACGEPGKLADDGLPIFLRFVET